MPDLDLTAYRATYDPEAWARVIEQYPTTDARTQLLVPACLAIRALCDEVERLRRGDSTCVDDDGTPFASARYWRAANSEACKRLLEASNALTDAHARAEQAERERDEIRAQRVAETERANRLAERVKFDVNPARQDVLDMAAHVAAGDVPMQSLLSALDDYYKAMKE